MSEPEMGLYYSKGLGAVVIQIEFKTGGSAKPVDELLGRKRETDKAGPRCCELNIGAGLQE
jgi:hypothetical protein